MVADRLAVALGAVLAAAQMELRLGRLRGTVDADDAQRRRYQPSLGRGADGRRLPVVEQPDDGFHVIDLDRAGDIGAPEAELAGRRDRVLECLLGAGPEGRATTVRGRNLGAVPELDRERAVREGALDLVDQGLGGHGFDSSGTRCFRVVRETEYSPIP